MHSINLDLINGSASMDSESIKTDSADVLVGSIARVCSPPLHMANGKTSYRFLNKVNLSGHSADAVIEVEEGGLLRLTLLFDLIVFFESSVLESKIVKALEKSSKVKFTSNHPSTASLGLRGWGSATFFYDAKQGDLSLEFLTERGSDVQTTRA